MNYGFVEEKNGSVTANSFAHSVVAYDVEYGQWDDIAPGYDGRILVYDCRKTEFDEEACIYFKSQTLDWFIPYQKLKYDRTAAVNHAAILLVSNNESLLNHCGCLTEKRTGQNPDDENLINPFYPEIIINGSDFSIRKATSDDTYAVNAADMEEDEIFSFLPFATGNETENSSYFMTDTDSSYAVFKSINGALQATMRYQDVRFDIDADMTHKVVFHPNASVSISGLNTDYRIDVVTNDTISVLPWFDLEITGITPDTVMLSQEKHGYLLEGDFTGPIRVTASNHDEAQAARSEDLSAYHRVHIVSSDKYSGMLDILVDKDADGICESSVLCIMPGDANCDGVANATDLTLLKRYLMTNQKAAASYSGMDMNRSGTVSTADVIALLRHLTNQ